MDNRNSTEPTSWQFALPVLVRLTSELEAASEALVRHDLKEFERLVARQGDLCELLQRTGLFGDRHEVRQVPVPAAAREVMHAIRAQNRIYAALHRRTERFVQAVLAFHQSARGYTPKGRVPLEASTWSSEA